MTIFIAGSSRSGTTMLGRILGRHPNIFTFHELHFFESIWEPDEPITPSRNQAVHMLELLFWRQREGLYSLPRAGVFSAEIEAILEDLGEGWSPADLFLRFLGFEAARQGASISCEQTPRNAAFAKTILEEFSDARVVWMVRDPRNVILSQKRKWKRARLSKNKKSITEGEEARPRPFRETLRAFFNYHPYTATRIWRAAARGARDFAQHPRVRIVAFESLLANPRMEVQGLCDFLRIPFDEAMLQVPAVGSSHRQDTDTNSGVNSSFAGDWREGGLDGFELKVCQAVARDEMSDNGYEQQAVRVGTLAPLKWALWTPLHLVGALLLNLGRGRSPWRALRRRLTGQANDH